jgi:dihydropteroate synthase
MSPAVIDLGDFAVMGIVNVTPDSFSDGGRYIDPARAVEHGLELEAEGAAILDVGGESTRPGAIPVTLEEELRRVIPVVEGLRDAGLAIPISVDTSKAAVADAALGVGATVINDVTALRGDPRMAEVVAVHQADLCLMHMLGEPRTMQEHPSYGEVVADVRGFLEARMAFALAAGIAPERILLDPGIGFGKTAAHNVELLRRLDEIAAIGRPVLVGTSRKSFLGRLTGRDVPDRLAATIATNVLAYERGARVFRVHDVGPVADALRITAATVPRPWLSTTPTPTMPTSTTTSRTPTTTRTASPSPR